MVSLEYETPNLLILAASTKPTNYFETIEYLKAALNELKLEPKTGISGVLTYCGYFIRKIVKGINVKENLSIVYRFCQQKNYEGSLYDFYLLYWAWGDLAYGNIYQEYWPGANIDNIEQVVIHKANEWLTANGERVVS